MFNISRCTWGVMTIGLAVLGLINAITIDNHLLNVKNDCYERLSLGQRLDPRDVIHTVPTRTVAACQAACSEEGVRCLSLSFGISPKGNGTCELSFAAIKETADLQPIGTIRDPDFDLYIKKSDCKLNIPKDPPSSDVQTPTYAVAVVDRPNSSPSHGYEVQENNARPKPPSRRPVQRPPDVFLFHGDQPSDYVPYQNYYDVPRPLPVAYGPDKDHEPIKPNLDYPQDAYYFYGMLRPQSDRYSPAYEDYYGHRRPQDDRKKPYDRNGYDNSRPSYDNRPYRPNSQSPDNPNVYDDRPPVYSPLYGVEPNRKVSNPSGYDNVRPNTYAPNYPGPSYPVRPYDNPSRPYDDNRKPYRPYDDDIRPYRPQNDNPRPYGPQNDDRPYGVPHDRPYRPYRPPVEDNRPPYGPVNDENRPYRPPNDNNRPYRPPVDDNRPPYGPVNDDNRPYRPPNDDNRPYRPPVDDNRPPYGPVNDDNRPYRPPNDDHRPPYGPVIEDNRPYRPPHDDNSPYRPPIDPRPSYDDNKPYRPPNDDYRPPYRPIIENSRPYGPSHDEPSPYRPPNDDHRPPYEDHRPYRPQNDRPYDSRPSTIPDNRPYTDNRIQVTNDDHRPSYGNEDYRPAVEYGKRPIEKNRDKNKPDPDNPNHYEGKGDWDRVGNTKPGEKQESGYGKPGYSQQQNTSQGSTVTSLITQIIEPCYRRVMAGKRVARNFIRRAVPCERVEDCQRECQDEKRFVCEGFNYRLDETGRGQGDCELTELPLSRMDPSRDIIPDRDYDFYEKDRDSGPDCRPLRPLLPGPGSGPGHGAPWHNYPPPPPPRRPALPPPHPPPAPPPQHYYSDRRKDGYHHGYFYYSSSDPRYGEHGHGGYHYPMPPPKPYHDYRGGERDRAHWGLPMYGYGHGQGQPHGYGYGHTGGYGGNRSNFVPYRIGEVGGPRDWGRYGGSYGGGYRQQDAYNYWGFNRHDYPDNRRIYHLPAPPPPVHSGPSGPPYLPGPPHHHEPPRHEPLPLPPPRHEPLPLPPPHEPPPLPPPPHREPPFYPPTSHGLPPSHNHIDFDGYHHHGHGSSYPQRDDCSTRQGMGFRLHKGVVKKFYAVPNIHECERLCYQEKDFNCVSFSFRNATATAIDDFDPWADLDSDLDFDWTSLTAERRILNSPSPRYSITLSSPTDNCYLSDRPYKDLDFYTELEPDRDFDIYTMHRTQSCLIPVVEEESECFLRVRSGQRLDSSVVKDTLDAKTIVECQLECLSTSRFTCRSFSYRWGPPHSGGAIDSCQLSDWPFAELDPRRDLVPEPGYEVYERGSYGHGCEHNHFQVPSHHGHLGPGQHVGDGSAVPKYSDKICYVGYAKPARLTPEAARGALSVSSELDCKAECTRAREQSAFQCMSFSFRSVAPRNQPNCELSDVEQRDLRPELDYHRDPESWLFAWDSLSPQCSALLDQQHGSHGQDHTHNPLDTWRVYSVSGWPCRRGTTCQENREAGFWSCELEGGDVGSWDYCCRPDHHCGYSEGYNYPWCYVGPSRDQWRTCSDRYYPYQQQDHQRHPPGGDPYLPRPTGHSSHSSWHSERPYRPPYANPAPGHDSAHRPSLDEYEDKFHQQFLETPRPGGLGRHWPVSYLHKETPPNATVTSTTTPSSEDRQHRKMDSAISNVVQAIQAADLNNTRYHAANQSDGADDVLFVRLPMPTSSSARLTEEDHTPKFDVVDTKTELPKNKSGDGFDELFLISPNPRNVTIPKRELAMFPNGTPVVRRGTITRTNRTARRRRLRPRNDIVQFIN